MRLDLGEGGFRLLGQVSAGQVSGRGEGAGRTASSSTDAQRYRPGDPLVLWFPFGACMSPIPSSLAICVDRIMVLCLSGSSLRKVAWLLSFDTAWSASERVLNGSPCFPRLPGRFLQRIEAWKFGAIRRNSLVTIV